MGQKRTAPFGAAQPSTMKKSNYLLYFFTTGRMLKGFQVFEKFIKLNPDAAVTCVSKPTLIHWLAN